MYIWRERVLLILLDDYITIVVRDNIFWIEKIWKEWKIECFKKTKTKNINKTKDTNERRKKQWATTQPSWRLAKELNKGSKNKH